MSKWNPRLTFLMNRFQPVKRFFSNISDKPKTNLFWKAANDNVAMVVGLAALAGSVAIAVSYVNSLKEDIKVNKVSFI